MTDYHPLWAPPSPAELEADAAAAERVAEAGASLHGAQIPIPVHLESIKTVSRHLVPILRLGNTKEDLEFVGTSVYINREDRHFLATANHVISEIEPSRVLLLTSIDGASSIPARSCISSNDDRADIALYELLEPLRHFSPFDYENVRPLTDEDSVVYMLGIPATRVSRRSKQHIKFEQRSVLTTIVKDGGQDFGHFDPQVNFVCDFRKEQVRNGDGRLVTFPDPYGMSGGPVFQPFYSEGRALLRYSLVGIMTEWNPVKKRYIRCTKAQVLRFMIDSLWNHLAHHRSV